MYFILSLSLNGSRFYISCVTYQNANIGNLFTSHENTLRVSKRNVGLTSVDNPSRARRTAAPWALREPAAHGNDWLRASLPSLSVRQSSRSAKHTSSEDIKKPQTVVHSVAVGAEMFSSLYPHHLLHHRHLRLRYSPRKRSQFILLIIHYYEPPGMPGVSLQRFGAHRCGTTPITVRHISIGNARWRSEP